MLTVKQLIALLEKQPLDAVVATRGNEDGNVANRVVLGDYHLYWKGDSPSTVHGLHTTNIVVISD